MSAGDPDETVSLADQALYQAKEAGRDQWIWATARRAPSYRPPRDYVQAYLRDAVLGNRRAAVRLTLDLLDKRVSREQIVEDLLAAAQREVGQRWYCNELTAADEHLASGVTAAALDTLMGEMSQPAGDGLTVVACAEGDFHSLAAQMFGELLREYGMGVTVLGASTPAEAVAEFLVRSGADSLAISCSVPIFFPGTVRLIDAAHRQGIPVIAGGPAFGNGPGRAERLGADAWALTAADAAAILLGWQSEPPPGQPRADARRPGSTSSHRTGRCAGRCRARRPRRPLPADGRLRRTPDGPHAGGSRVHRPVPGRGAARCRPGDLRRLPQLAGEPCSSSAACRRRP